MSARQKAIDKQALLEAEREKKAAAEREKDEAAEWAKGAKDNSKLKASEDKEQEKARLKAEKAALESAEEAELSGVKMGKKIKKKGKDDFDLLNAALAGAPKSKAQKDAELKKKEAEQQKLKEAEARAKKEERKKAEDEAIKKAAAKGIIMNHTDDLMVPINNRLEEDDFEHAAGLDAAIDLLSVDPSKPAEHPERRRKALYSAYFDAQLPIMKEEHPGLKLSQYKERIFDLWKASPENPENMPR